MLQKNIHAHGHRHLPQNLSQERCIEIGNQLSYSGCTIVITAVCVQIDNVSVIPDLLSISVRR